MGTQTKKKKENHPKAQENADNKVLISVSFASDWLISGPITELMKANQYNPRLLSTLNWKFLQLQQV